MMEILFEISEDGSARKRVEENGEVVAIEDYNFFDKGVLILEFDKKLKLTKQTFLEGKKVYDVLSKLIKFCNEKGIKLRINKVKQIQELKLPYKCPFCKEEKLRLKIYKEIKENRLKSIPIIPIVYCENCKRESLYLSNELLKNLVLENKQLFTQEELIFFENEEEKFLKELRASIAAVFGKKKIGIVKFE